MENLLGELEMAQRIYRRIADGQSIGDKHQSLQLHVSQIQSVYCKDDIFKTICDAYYLGLSKGYRYRKQKARH